MQTKINPPALYKLSIGAMIISIFLPLDRTIQYPYNLTGLILLFSGTFIALYAKRTFKNTNTPMSPSARPVKLHTDGFFKYTRNPMYLGIVIGLTGIALLTGLLYNIIFPVSYLIIMNNVFIKLEEKNLENEFGEKFLRYKTRTRRWI